ncbi:ATP-binding protein [Streptomyces sp. CB01635]|uniref:sensor histidine kinase n=1 Tax=Streptomyces sp. CB01635 TaxID=2020326 RepID=UPI000C2778DB|nr:ATP-binding protein [Streptomyces sp. CB01635]PJN07412.1 ATP-binding protein [Streptomyces sp. CB01635]
MPVPARPTPRRTPTSRRSTLAVPLAVLVVAGAAVGAVTAAAPQASRTWVLVALLISWLCVAAALITAALLQQRARAAVDTAQGESLALQQQLTQRGAEAAHLVNVTLPSVSKRLRDGAGAEEALAATAPPADPQLNLVLKAFTAELDDAVRREASAVATGQDAAHRIARTDRDLDELTTSTLPAAVVALREGSTAAAVLSGLGLPDNAHLRTLAESLVRELATSERRAAAAQAASAKALSRVQAKSVSMLADLREMQDRHGEEVFGDLLRLDHNTSQLGLLTDRLALLMGGRASRAWNKPIVMESILRGAVGRIAAYQRVRLHCATNAAIAGFAAEGVMHLLAELMDNAANFSPPIDEVHVYVEERSAGIVVTIEDSGLKMADAAMRRAEAAVSGRETDLASLQGTRLGLAVVGRLAAKYRMSVNFRPSSRGGTGVVVLLPPQLLAQQRDPAPQQPPVRRAAAPAPVTAPDPAPQASDDTTPGIPAQADPPPATPGGLPVRAPGRTMASAERDRKDRAPTEGGGPAEESVRAPRNAGAQFGAFHRARRARDETPGTSPEMPGRADEPPAE